MLANRNDDVLTNTQEEPMFKQNRIALMIQLSLKRRGEFPNNFSLDIPLPQILSIIVIVKIAIDSMNKVRTNILVPHIDVDSVQPRMYFDGLGFELLNDVPDLVDGISIEQAGHELDGDVEGYFIDILRSDVPVADGDHCGRSPVQCIDILHSK